MAQIDIVILLLIVWGGFRGWKNGLLKEIVSSLGFIVGLVVAYQLYDCCGEWLSPRITQNASVGKVVGRFLAFILLWVVSPIVLGMVANMLTHTLKGLKMGLPNSVSGMLVGVAKYLILMSVILAAMNYTGILSEEKCKGAVLYQPVSSLCSFVYTHYKTQEAAQEADTIRPDTVWIPINHSEK